MTINEILLTKQLIVDPCCLTDANFDSKLDLPGSKLPGVVYIKGKYKNESD